MMPSFAAMEPFRAFFRACCFYKSDPECRAYVEKFLDEHPNPVFVDKVRKFLQSL